MIKPKICSSLLILLAGLLIGLVVVGCQSPPPAAETPATATATLAPPTPTASPAPETPAPSPAPETPTPTATVWARPAPIPVAQMRGVWIQVAELESPETVDSALERLEAGHFNTAFLNVNTLGRAYYRSDLLPWAEVVTEEYDPLAYFLAGAAARGITVHAWVVVGSMVQEWDGEPGPILAEHPDWALLDGAGQPTQWLDYRQPGAAHFVEQVALEVATRYPVAGIHLDYIRYPSWDWGDPTTAENVARRVALNQLVAGIHHRLQADAPGLQLSAAVFYNQGVANEVLQDWSTWLAADSVDFVVPMAYIGHDDLELLAEIVQWWHSDYGPDTAQIVPGLAVQAFNFGNEDDPGTPKSPAEVQAELALVQEAGLERVVLFDLGLMSDEVLTAVADSPLFAP